MIEKVLITGGAGFIGSSFAERLLKSNNYEVTIIDDLSSGNISNIKRIKDNVHFRFEKGDVNNYNDISKLMISKKFDYVFHYAAVVGVEYTQKNPVKVLNDIEGIKNICSLCKKLNVKRLFYSSSSEVYGEPVEIPQNEYTTPLNSRVPYAVVKNVGESFLKSYNKEFGLNYTVFRFFNTYGPAQSNNFVVSRFIYQALYGNEITIYGDGKQSRTFCYIDDNCEVCYKILHENLLTNDVVNIGNDVSVSINELAYIILKLTNSKNKIKYCSPLKEGDMKRRLPDITKMKSILKKSLISLEDGIQLILRKPLFINNVSSSNKCNC